jgi:glycosyltransferase involved in cell wall biosynthesis
MLNSKVSVIIPVYNSEKFLKESIESVIHQTYSDIEIIAINDGSTDGSLEILKQYEDKIIIIDQKNMGLAEAVNAGIKKMSGNWLKWLSPDDVLYSNAVEILVEEAKKLPENTILYSNWKMIDEKRKKLRDFTESNYNNLSNFDFNVRLLDGQQININTCLIPSLLFKKGCVLRTLDDIIAIDYDFFLRSGILFDTKFHLVEKNTLQYRIHKDQASHKDITESLKYLKNIRENILSKLDYKDSNQYLKALKQYSKNKKIKKKTLCLGLKILSILPTNISDKMLIFYLNKIRSGR